MAVHIRINRDVFCVGFFSGLSMMWYAVLTLVIVARLYLILIAGLIVMNGKTTRRPMTKIIAEKHEYQNCGRKVYKKTRRRRKCREINYKTG